MQNLKEDEIRQTVREKYGSIAEADREGCGCGPTSCCGPESKPQADDISKAMGYSEDEVSTVPEGANMGLGCGNPVAIASLKPGETVLDLGSGGGFDCFLAAAKVGAEGLVIGIDMTPKMISKARQNAVKAGVENLEFRLGEIERLPVADNSIDIVISNCVINLSPAKQDVYNETFRVLKSGGRLAVSDMVATAELPEELRENLALYAGCVTGASTIDEVKSMLEIAGFVDIRVEPKVESKDFIREWGEENGPDVRIADYVISASIEAVKP